MKQRHEQAERLNARIILQQCGIRLGVEFSTLSTRQGDRLREAADRVKYQRPSAVKGSRERYFHDQLQRRAAFDSRMTKPLTYSFRVEPLDGGCFPAQVVATSSDIAARKVQAMWPDATVTSSVVSEHLPSVVFTTTATLNGTYTKEQLLAIVEKMNLCA